MKIQFLDDEIRNHDDRTGKYHNNSLGGAVDEDEDQTTRDPEVTESWRDDLDGWGGRSGSVGHSSRRKRRS